MKKIGILMSILMGFTMSLVLSFLGTMMSGHFSIPSWLISFGISFAISLVIGFIVPIKKVCDYVCQKLSVNPQSLKGNAISSFISDLIYTPIITVSMVVIMVGNAQKQMAALGITEGVPTIPQVLIPSLISCFIVGYFVIFITQPLFLKMLLKKN